MATLISSSSLGNPPRTHCCTQGPWPLARRPVAALGCHGSPQDRAVPGLVPATIALTLADALRCHGSGHRDPFLTLVPRTPTLGPAAMGIGTVTCTQGPWPGTAAMDTGTEPWATVGCRGHQPKVPWPGPGPWKGTRGAVVMVDGHGVLLWAGAEGISLPGLSLGLCLALC